METEPPVGDNLHPLGGQLLHVHISGEGVPPHHSCGGERALWVLEWDLGTSRRESWLSTVCATLRPPGCSQVPQVEHLLNLCLVKHSQYGNPPLVLQAVPHCWLCCWICWPLLLLLQISLLIIMAYQLMVGKFKLIKL